MRQKYVALMYQFIDNFDFILSPDRVFSNGKE